MIYDTNTSSQESFNEEALEDLLKSHRSTTYTSVGKTDEGMPQKIMTKTHAPGNNNLYALSKNPCGVINSKGNTEHSGQHDSGLGDPYEKWGSS